MAKEKNGKRIEELTKQLCQPIIEKNGFKLWDVCFEKEGAMWYLRVLFDKDGGIDSDDCEAVTEPINKLIDKQDFIDNIDILEIGSPGLTKRLRSSEHFAACMNTPIRAVIRGEKGKEINVYGTLVDFADDVITIDDNGTKTTLNFADCIKVNSNL